MLLDLVPTAILSACPAMAFLRVARACRFCAVRAISTASLTTEQLKRRCQRLQQLYGSLERNLLAEFEFDDVVYKLPLRSVRRTSQQPLDQGELEYMSGFFDGDGSVSVNKNRPCLSISQDARRAQVLMKFRQQLGGGVYSHGIKKANQMPCLKWFAGGENGVQAAALLGSQPSMKQAQLQIAAAWPSSHADRILAAQQLIRLKSKDYRPQSFKCSWPYFAGFFDADGSIIVRAESCTLALSLVQANPFLLDRLYEFLVEHQIARWQPVRCHADGMYRLECSHTDTCIHTLQKLMGSGLLLKMDQARLVLALNKDNYLKVRERLFEMHGRQGRYKRLDADGIARAREIRNLARCRRRSRDVDKEDRLRELRDHHSRKNMESRLLLLRQDIRNFLQEENLSPVPSLIVHIFQIPSCLVGSDPQVDTYLRRRGVEGLNAYLTGQR